MDENELLAVVTKLSLGITPQQTLEFLRGMGQMDIEGRGVDVTSFVENLQVSMITGINGADILYDHSCCWISKHCNANASH